MSEANRLGEQEILLLVKRTGIDKTWQVAPYPIKTVESAQRLVAFLQKAWGIPFEHKVLS